MIREQAISVLEARLMSDDVIYVREFSYAEALEMAIEALKAQEPRIVTEADFENADEAGFIPAWCEEKDTGEVYCECIPIGALEDAKFGHVRWWTSRPSDEVRRTTPWE